MAYLSLFAIGGVLSKPLLLLSSAPAFMALFLPVFLYLTRNRKDRLMLALVYGILLAVFIVFNGYLVDQSIQESTKVYLSSAIGN